MKGRVEQLNNTLKLHGIQINSGKVLKQQLLKDTGTRKKESNVVLKL